MESSFSSQVGFMNNLAELLSSPPDEISQLNGVELVRQKVTDRCVWGWKLVVNFLDNRSLIMITCITSSHLYEIKVPWAKNADRYFQVALVAIMGGAYPIVHYTLYCVFPGCIGGNYGRGVPRRARIQLWLWWGEKFLLFTYILQDLIPNYTFSIRLLVQEAKCTVSFLTQYPKDWTKINVHEKQQLSKTRKWKWLSHQCCMGDAHECWGTAR